MMNDKVGAGVYIPDTVGNGSPIEMAYHIGERSTVFQEETFAVEQAAKLLRVRDNGTTNKTIVINCDSQAAIRAVDSTIIKSGNLILRLRKVGARLGQGWGKVLSKVGARSGQGWGKVRAKSKVRARFGQARLGQGSGKVGARLGQGWGKVWTKSKLGAS